MCDFGEDAGLKKQPTCIRCQYGATVLSLWVRTKLGFSMRVMVSASSTSMHMDATD